MRWSLLPAFAAAAAAARVPGCQESGPTCPDGKCVTSPSRWESDGAGGCRPIGDSCNASAIEDLPATCEPQSKSFAYVDASSPVGTAADALIGCWRVNCPGPVQFDWVYFETYCSAQDSNQYNCGSGWCDDLSIFTFVVDQSDATNQYSNIGCLRTFPYPCGDLRQSNLSQCPAGSRGCGSECAAPPEPPRGLLLQLARRTQGSTPISLSGGRAAGFEITFSCPAMCTPAPTPEPPKTPAPPQPTVAVADLGVHGTVTFTQPPGDVNVMLAVNLTGLPAGGVWWGIHEFPHAGWQPPGGSTWAECVAPGYTGDVGELYSWPGGSGDLAASFGVLPAGNVLRNYGPTLMPLQGMDSVAGRSVVLRKGPNATSEMLWCGLVSHTQELVAAGRAVLQAAQLTVTLDGPGGDATVMMERRSSSKSPPIAILRHPAVCSGGKLANHSGADFFPAQGMQLRQRARGLTTVPGGLVPSWLSHEMLLGGVVATLEGSPPAPKVGFSDCAALTGEDECTTLPCGNRAHCLDPDRGARGTVMCFCLPSEVCTDCTGNGSVEFSLPAALAGAPVDDFGVVNGATAASGASLISGSTAQLPPYTVGRAPTCVPRQDDSTPTLQAPLIVILCVLLLVFFVTAVLTAVTKRELNSSGQTSGYDLNAHVGDKVDRQREQADRIAQDQQARYAEVREQEMQLGSEISKRSRLLEEKFSEMRSKPAERSQLQPIREDVEEVSRETLRQLERLRHEAYELLQPQL